MHHKLHSMRVKLNFSMLCPSIAGLFDVRFSGYDPFLVVLENSNVAKLASTQYLAVYSLP